MRMLSVWGIACVLGLAGMGLPREAHAPPPTDRPSPRSSISRTLDRLAGPIARDFGLVPTRVMVLNYPSHATFAGALRRLHRPGPQGAFDNNGGIVHGYLIVGPLGHWYLDHDLAHVYTEWLLDRLTGNSGDALPNGTWLYDGLAEYEAYRHVSKGPACTAPSFPFPITSVSTSREWMRLRGGPWEGMEYCLAYLEVRSIVRRLGWQEVVSSLRQHRSWSWSARVLSRSLVARRGYVSPARSLRTS